jgi:hypothetical protein
MNTEMPQCHVHKPVRAYYASIVHLSRMDVDDMAAAMTYNNEPSFGLKVRNRLPSGSATEDTLFTLSRNGRAVGIIELFRQRKASPNDLSAEAGQTAIHVSAAVISTCPTARLCLVCSRLRLELTSYGKVRSGIGPRRDLPILT